MSARADRRRRREEALAGAKDAPAATVAPSSAKAPRAPRGQRRLPLLPFVAAGSGLALLGAAYLTSLPPGEGSGGGGAGRFTVEIPAEQQPLVNSWERFFICYDLTDPAIVDLTLRANLRSTGTLDFPGARVEVELPQTAERGAPRPPAGAADSEEELINLRQRIDDARTLGAVRQQCGVAAPVPA